MITRICAGLPAALVSLDEDAGRAMRDRIDAVHSATGLLADAGSRGPVAGHAGAGGGLRLPR